MPVDQQTRYKVAQNKFLDVLNNTLEPVHRNDETIVKFISHYIVSKNLKEAAKEAVINMADAKYLYNQPDIYKAITALLESEVVKFGYNAAEVVERAKDIAFLDPLDCMNPDGTYKKSLADIPAGTRHAIKRIRVKNTYTEDMNGVMQYSGEIIDIEFWDKPKTLELLGREKDTFKKTTVVQHDLSKNARNYLLASVQRAEQLPAPAETRDAQVIDVTPVERPTIPKPPGM